MKNPAYIVAAMRTPVAPRGGALAAYQSTELGAIVIEQLVSQSRIDICHIDHVILGNALYAGGNPARVAALAAGLLQSTPAMTIDTQCCAGMDAINTACALIQSGAAKAVIAGGIESFSRAPIRQYRPLEKHGAPVAYQRPPFTPWPDRDPDMIESAAALAVSRGITREAQEQFSIASHQRALNAPISATEVVAIDGLNTDSFTRNLSKKTCARAPIIAGNQETGLTSTTIAVEADAAACVLVVSEAMLSKIAPTAGVLKAVGMCSVGTDPCMPSLAPVDAVNKLFAATGVQSSHLVCAEVMEAFAVQAMACVDDCEIAPAIVNRSGGALSRGHPIGASGAILAVRLWHEMQKQKTGDLGLAAIAAAGGLGAALLWSAQ